jgi:predicted secreted protein
MRPVTMGLAATCSAVFALGACNDGHAPPTGPQSSGSTAAPSSTLDGGDLVVTADDDGKTIDALRGATVTFRLETRAGTGYAWTPTLLDTGLLTQQGDRASELASSAPGARKLDVYRFTASTAGSTEVEMSLKRPFGDEPPAHTLHVTIRIHRGTTRQ